MENQTGTYIMIAHCSQCGAIFPSGETCRDRFDRTQAMEFTNTAYFAVHQLSVPCYMLQHNYYSRDGWLATQQLLRQFVYDKLSPGEAQQQLQTAASSLQRTKKSWTNGEKLIEVAAIVWTQTIFDVPFETAAEYCAGVRAWAIAVITDTTELVQSLSTTS